MSSPTEDDHDVPLGVFRRDASSQGNDNRREGPPMHRYRTSHRQYSPREYSPPSHQGRQGPPSAPYSNYAYDPHPPHNAYPYNPYHRDYHGDYQMGPPMHSPHYPQYPQYPNYVPVPPAPFPPQQVVCQGSFRFFSPCKKSRKTRG